MKKIIIEGGHPLLGSVKAAGSKNSALPILIATLLTDEPCTITNVPWLEDIRTTVGILEHCGKRVNRHGDRLVITKAREAKTTAPYDLVKRMRASVLVAGPLLARYHKVSVSLPGGCAIGTRPINIHLHGFEQLGASIKFTQGFVKMSAKTLRGTELLLDFPSVGATENLLMAAVLASGKTVIDNAALEPEIEDLAQCLRSMGARISGIGTKRLSINGVGRLHGTAHAVIPDRIESATYLMAGVITRGNVTVKNTEPAHLEALMVKLKQAGVAVQIKGKSLSVKASSKARHSTDIQTAPFPGFATDLQPLWLALMSMTPGKSIVKETVFENRFMHVAELNRMGAGIRVNGNTAVVQGVSQLSGAPVMCADLRAGAALVLAALAAKGTTEISRIYHLDRGYADLEKKLRSLGGRIRRVET